MVNLLKSTNLLVNQPIGIPKLRKRVWKWFWKMKWNMDTLGKEELSLRQIHLYCFQNLFKIVLISFFYELLLYVLERFRRWTWNSARLSFLLGTFIQRGLIFRRKFASVTRGLIFGGYIRGVGLCSGFYDIHDMQIHLDITYCKPYDEWNDGR